MCPIAYANVAAHSHTRKKHVSQQRAGLRMPNCGMHCSRREHASQTTRPHARQWCLAHACCAADRALLSRRSDSSRALRLLLLLLLLPRGDSSGVVEEGGGISAGKGDLEVLGGAGGVLDEAAVAVAVSDHGSCCSQVKGEPQHAHASPASLYGTHRGGWLIACWAARHDLSASR